MASERQPRVPFKVSDAANSLISVAGPLICSLCPKIGKRCKKKSSQNYTRHRHTLGTSPRACGSPPGPAVWVLLPPALSRCHHVHPAGYSLIQAASRRLSALHAPSQLRYRAPSCPPLNAPDRTLPWAQLDTILLYVNYISIKPLSKKLKICLESRSPPPRSSVGPDVLPALRGYRPPHSGRGNILSCALEKGQACPPPAERTWGPFYELQGTKPFPKRTGLKPSPVLQEPFPACDHVADPVRDTEYIEIDTTSSLARFLQLLLTGSTCMVLKITHLLFQ